MREFALWCCYMYHKYVGNLLICRLMHKMNLRKNRGVAKQPYRVASDGKKNKRNSVGGVRVAKGKKTWEFIY